MGPRPPGIIGLYTAFHWTTRTRHHRQEEFGNTLDFYRALAKWNASDPRAWTYLEGHVEPFAGELGSFPERNTSRVPHENPETRLLRVVVTVQDADKTWPAAYDSFFEIPAYFIAQPGYVKTLRPVQCLVNDALTSARR